MLLRNYDNFMTLISLGNLTGVDAGDKTSFDDEHLCIKGWNSNTLYTVRINTSNGTFSPFQMFSYSTGSGSAVFYSGPTNCSTLVAGSGDTPVTYDDNDLANVFTPSQVQKISCSAGDAIYNPTDKTWEKTHTCTCLAKEDLIIREVGVTHSFYCTYNSVTIALVYRKVLDTPIEVPVNANFVLSFTTKVSANPNKPADYDANAVLVE